MSTSSASFVPTPSGDPDLGLVREEAPEELSPLSVARQLAEREHLENRRLRAIIDDLEQDRAQRKQYSARLFWLVVGWLFAVGGVLLLHGFSAWSFELSEIVLTTLISTTTVSVLGLFTIVARYLFPNR